MQISRIRNKWEYRNAKDIVIAFMMQYSIKERVTMYESILEAKTGNNILDSIIHHIFEYEYRYGIERHMTLSANLRYSLDSLYI